MKGVLKLIDITEKANVGDHFVRNLNGVLFIEIWAKKSKLTRVGQIGNIKKLVVLTPEETYNIESYNWNVYMNSELMEVEKEYAVKTIGDKLYAIVFGEGKSEIDMLTDIKKDYDEIITKYPALLTKENLYTDKDVARLLLLILTKIGVHAEEIGQSFTEWKNEF